MVETNSNPSKRYLMAILRWCLVAIVVFILTILGGVYVVCKVLPKTYAAMAQVQIPPRNDRMDPTNSQADADVIQSPVFLLAVINNLGLDKAWAKRLHLSKEDQLSPLAAITHMQQVLKVAGIRGTNIVTITASSDLPAEAAAIANGVADQYKIASNFAVYTRMNKDKDALVDNLAQEIKVVDQAKANLDKLTLGLKGVAKPSTSQEITLRTADRYYQEQLRLYNTYQMRLRDMTDHPQIPESPVRIVARAGVPQAPILPNKIVWGVLTILVGLILSILVASFLEIVIHFSRTPKRV